MGRRRTFFFTPSDHHDPESAVRILLCYGRPLDTRKRGDLSQLLERFGEDEESIPLPLLVEVETALEILRL